jgi:hypothetical protein
VAAQAKRCRRNFLPGITDLRLSAKPLWEDPPTGLNLDKTEELMLRHAKALAPLLLRMPRVATINAGADPWLHHALGPAFTYYVIGGASPISRS